MIVWHVVLVIAILIAGIIGVFTLFYMGASRAAKRETVFPDEPEGLPEATDAFEVVSEGTATVRYLCGHDGPKKFTWDVYGDTLRPSAKYLKKRDRCPQCVLDMLGDHHIRCACCGLIILPGEPVALYAGGEGFREEIATKVDGQWIGCMRMGCCDSGGFFAGNWTRAGFRPAYPGGMTAFAVACSTGKPVIGNMTEDGQMHITIFDDTGSDEKDGGAPPSS